MRNFIYSDFPKTILILASLGFALHLQAQDDDFEDFDPSMFEEVGESVKSFATSKVLGQSPSLLISVGYDMQGPAGLNVGAYDSYPSEDVELGLSQGFRFVSNVPILSRNNILINWGISYVHLGYARSEDKVTGPFSENLINHDLKWLNTNFTVFKPLNENRFLLMQLGAEFNGDYGFDNMPSMENMRVPAAFIYGFKPNDKLMWGPGVSRTYLGGALNYLPVIYYYHTFDNRKWGVEALFPARVQFRYRKDSRSVIMMGYQVEGATYQLSNINDYQAIGSNANFEDIELRRSEIRTGLTYQRGVNDFLWFSIQAGVRLNYSYNVDEGNFYRGFDDEGFFIENQLNTAFYAQLTFSMVSP
ncbi:MAG: hypothetical protein JXR10_12335 [Cyclobacteriaceae bacterium]